MCRVAPDSRKFAAASSASVGVRKLFTPVVFCLDAQGPAENSNRRVVGSTPEETSSRLLAWWPVGLRLAGCLLRRLLAGVCIVVTGDWDGCHARGHGAGFEASFLPHLVRGDAMSRARATRNATTCVGAPRAPGARSLAAIAMSAIKVLKRGVSICGEKAPPQKHRARALRGIRARHLARHSFPTPCRRPHARRAR